MYQFEYDQWLGTQAAHSQSNFFSILCIFLETNGQNNRLAINIFENFEKLVLSQVTEIVRKSNIIYSTNYLLDLLNVFGARK